MMDRHAAREIAANGLWRQNAGLVQILGLCPVLVISSNIVNGVSLGLATSLVMLVSGAAVAALRQFVPNELRSPIFILIIAALVTVVDLLLNAYVHGLYLVLGIFIPLITTNCIVLARAEAFASRNGVAQSALDGLTMGLGLTGVLAVLGGLRELVGHGTLLSGIDLVFGPAARGWVIHVIPADAHYQFLLAILPPGAFFGLAFLIAGKSALDRRAARRAAGSEVMAGTMNSVSR
ncbi:electron transport complex subunit E [Chitiniphilus shinanonensis]|uniref:Ion-translocating oxidoreductase complex subunit E n=1 Tax=Chitiniphilus shinanonensis TaxID=553088 RepID=A0ABQ6BW17_9NEIS|nr:electron transport complex subunit E [Chitiniphilus shinanonensis]GLS06143.1 electron transport complex subunit E [Chitiniphilus shinanonensis]